MQEFSDEFVCRVANKEIDPFEKCDWCGMTVGEVDIQEILFTDYVKSAFRREYVCTKCFREFMELRNNTMIGHGKDPNY